MRFSTLSIVGAAAAFSSLAVAQDCIATALAVIPACAQSCILNGAPSVGCGGTDFSCQCGKQAALMAAVEPCVASACPTASVQAVIDGAATVCDCAGAVATGTNTVAASVQPSVTATATKPPTTVPTAAANRPVVGLELGAAAAVIGGTLFAAIAL